MARRALLTDAEREALQNPESRDNPYVAVSRVRKKISEELTEDVRILQEHNQELLDELRDVVCTDEAPAARGAATAATVEAARASEPAEQSHNVADERSSSDPVNDMELEGQGSVLDERRSALRAIVEHLREEGTATSQELKQIAEDYDFGYQGEVDNFWSNIRRQNALEELPIETPGQGGRTYRYTGDND